MKKTQTLDVTFDVQAVRSAVEDAWSAGVLCGTCTRKLDTSDGMSQSDFCAECQAAITSQLMIEAESRLVEALIRMGLPPNSVQIVND